MRGGSGKATYYVRVKQYIRKIYHVGTKLTNCGQRRTRRDALWFHEIADKYVRCYQGEEKKLAYQRGYRDYDRLNYLLIKEFHLKRIDFTETEIPIDEISAEKLLVGEKNFKRWFDAIPCDKEDLDIYTWDIIEQYIKKCVRFCISEVNALKNGEKGCDPENLFAKA